MFSVLFQLYLFIFLGFLISKFKKLNTHTLSIVLIYIFTPALIFTSIYNKKIDSNYLLLPIIFALTLLIIYLISVIASKFLTKNFCLQKAFQATSTTVNTGYFGIPIVFSLFGAEGISALILIDLADTIIIYTLGVYLFSCGKNNIFKSLGHIFTLPTLWILIIALILNKIAIPIPELILNSIDLLSKATIPLATVILGIFLGSITFEQLNWRLIPLVSVFQLFLMPLFALLISSFFPLNNIAQNVLLVACMMPSAVVNINLADLYSSEGKFVTGGVFLSTLLAIITVPLWLFTLNII